MATVRRDDRGGDGPRVAACTTNAGQRRPAGIPRLCAASSEPPISPVARRGPPGVRLKSYPRLMTGLSYLATETLVWGQDAWTEVQHYSVVTPDATQGQLLSALLGHARYRRTFLDPVTDPTEASDLHGPFVVDAVTPAAFQPTDASTVRSELEGWLREWAQVDDIWATYLARLDALAEQASILRLSATHLPKVEWSGVWHAWHEFVFIRPDRLTLVVASGD